MDGPPRRPPVLRQRSDSQGRALSPADSVTSIGSTRGPLLSVMFHHIRRDNQDSLTKEDLRRLLDVDMDNEQLDEAFENLDVDGDGRVSLDEFLGGFARFLLEAPTTPGKDRNSLLLAEQGSQRGSGRGGGGGRKRGSVRRRLVDEECFESSETTHAVNGGGAERPGENGGPAVKPSETFDGSLSTLSSHNRHSIVTLWRGLAGTNPELLVDFEEFVGEVAEEVEHAQRALANQRKATKQEALELDQEMESRLNAANTHLQIQTALTEVKTKLKLEQKLGDKEMELSAVKYKLQELNSRLESVCNFALQLETEVEAGQLAHTQLEEQYEALSQEKADLQTRLEVREAVLKRKHEEMERLHKQASENVTMHSSHFEETQVELQEIKIQYEREISELKEKIMGYEITSGGSDDEEMSLLSGQTPDLLSTSRYRHTSRHSLLDEIVKQEGLECSILRGEPLMPDLSHDQSLSGALWRANSLPNLFRTRQHLDPLATSRFTHTPTPTTATPSHRATATHTQTEPPVSTDTLTTDRNREEESKQGDHVTQAPDHVTQASGHVTSDGLLPVATLDNSLPVESPFSRARSLTVSGGGRPKFRPRKPKKTPSAQSSGSTDLSHVTSHDSHMTGGHDEVPSVAVSAARTTERREEKEEEDKEVGSERQKDEQYIMKCQVGLQDRKLF